MITLALLQEALPEDAATFQLTWVDWVGVVLGGVFLLLGLLRGLWWQVIRFAGLAASAALARTFADGWGQQLAESTDVSPEVAVGIVWVSLFIIGIVVTALLGTIGKRSLEAMKLGLVDRAGGAAAGLATGLFLHVAFLLVLAYMGPQPWTDKTLDGTYSRSLLQIVTTRHSVLAKSDSPSTEILQDWLGKGTPIFGSADGADDASPESSDSGGGKVQ
jgi:uncharacterized membrane protein required for colicin V production